MAKASTRRPTNTQDDSRDRKFVEVDIPEADRPRGGVSDTEAPRKVRLGPLKNLLGVWKGAGTGWNMIALPFQGAPAPPAGFNFRVLMNQYDEELQFTFVDAGVPNRGLAVTSGGQADQFVVTMDYQQRIAQVVAEDRPVSGEAGGAGLPIHHEPGLWLYMRNLRSKDEEGTINVARLASIPHGNSVLALGHSARHRGMPEIPRVGALPFGRFEDLGSGDYDFKSDPYLAPYKHYIDNPFMGNETTPGFPGFSPADMNEILRFENRDVDIVRTTTLTVDTTRRRGGVTNAPFVTRHAEPVRMKSTFWIQELKEKDRYGKRKLRLQYSQVVMLDFFRPREDEMPGRASWPHISIATLEKVPADYKLVAG